jgi:hypothetical protein
MYRALAAALGLLLGSLAGRAAALEPDTFECVVAVVRGPGAPQPRVITLTRLEDEARIALVSRGALAAASAPLDDAALRAALEWVVDQTLLGDDVSRLQVFEVDPAEVEEALRRFAARFEKPGDYALFLERNELAPEDVAAVLRRTMRVERYVESRAGRATAVSDGEVEAFVVANPERIPPGDPDAARRAVRARLAQRKLEDHVRALVQDLRRRSDLRIADGCGASR